MRRDHTAAAIRASARMFHCHYQRRHSYAPMLARLLVLLPLASVLLLH